MSWIRTSDDFTEDRRWDHVSYPARWYYLALVHACSRQERYDCLMPRRVALRLSDVDDTAAALAELHAAGLILADDETIVVVEGEERHMPPEHMRDRKRKAQQRKDTAAYRQRRCAEGKHDRHCPRTCPVRSKSEHSEGVSNDAGNGAGKCLPQDRTGQDRQQLGEVLSESMETGTQPLEHDHVGGPLGLLKTCPGCGVAYVTACASCKATA